MKLITLELLAVLKISVFQLAKPQECSTVIADKGIGGSDYKNPGSMTFSQCCETCRNELALYMSFAGPKTHTGTSTCYCYFSGDITSSGGWSLLTFTRKMFNIANITSGEKNSIKVVDTFTEAKANDRSEFYTFGNISTASTPLNIIDFLSYTPKLDGIKPKTDPTNFRNNSYLFDYNKQVSNAKPYELNVRLFGLDGKKSVDWLWFAMVRTNDEFMVFHAEKIKVVETTLHYNLKVDKFDIQNRLDANDTSFFAIIKLSATTALSDSSNLFISLIMEETVEILRVVPSEWNGQKCVWFNKIYKRSNSITTFQYDVLYNQKPVCFAVTVVVKEEAKLLQGVKPFHIMVEFQYNRIHNTVLQPQKKVANAYSAIVDENHALKSFSLYYKSFEICLMPQSGGRRTRLKLDDVEKATKIHEYCARLLKIGRNLKTDIHDDCLQIGNKATQIYDQCSTQYTIIDYKDDETLLVNNERPVRISGSQMISDNPGVTQTKFQKVYRKSFGLTKGKAKQFYTSEVITSVKCGEDICTCVLSRNRTTSKCFAINAANRATKIFSTLVQEVIAYNRKTNLTYGKDIDGKILQIGKTANAKIAKFISNTRWDTIKTNDIQFVVFAVKAEREELANSPVMINEKYNLTYFGLFEGNQMIALLQTDENCQDNVGTTRETAMKSCNAHKLYCPNAKSRVYYVSKAYNDPAYGEVYCDMETDGGGWMMITNYEANNIKPPKSQFSSLYNTKDIFEVVNSNYTKVINSYGGLTNIEANCGEIVQVRWYCTKSDHGRTIHVATNRNSYGLQYIQFLQGETTYSPLCCKVMYIYKDDTSKIFEKCDKIGASPGSPSSYATGHCTGYSYLTDRINVNPFYYKTERTLNTPYHFCDDAPADTQAPTKYGFWKVYVRNAI